MKIQFNEQVLYGSRVYAEGEVVDAPDGIAAYALAHRHAVEYVEAPAPNPVREAVREAVSVLPAKARKAVRRGR
jgi:hypothetical protein